MNRKKAISIAKDTIKVAKKIIKDNKKTALVIAGAGTALIGGFILGVKGFKRKKNYYKTLPKNKRKAIDRIMRILDKYGIELEAYADKSFIAAALDSDYVLSTLTSVLGNIDKYTDEKIIDVTYNIIYQDPAVLSRLSVPEKIDKIFEHYDYL